MRKVKNRYAVFGGRFVSRCFLQNDSKADVTSSCETMHDLRVNVTHRTIERVCTTTVSEQGGSAQCTVSVGFFADGENHIPILSARSQNRYAVSLLPSDAESPPMQSERQQYE